MLLCTSSEIQDYLGNLWAIFFARLGSSMHQVPDVYVKAERAQIKKHQLTWDFLARAIQIISIAGELVEVPQPPPRQVPSTAPKLSLSQHELCYVEARGEWR
eukprot:5815330-Pyramimonas_sp.AAC.1